MFEEHTQHQHKPKTLHMLELFAGGGTPVLALERNGFKVIAEPVEFDKNPMKIYNAIHGTKFLTADVMNYTPKREQYDIVWNSTPCQSFSAQGLQKGAEDELKGAPLWEATVNLIKRAKAPVVVMENVRGLTFQKHKDLLNWYLTELNKLGYTTKLKVLHSNNFGTPQKRARVFIVSTQEDINFEFPEGEDFTGTIKDYLNITELNPERECVIKSFKSENKFTDIKTSHTHTLTRTGALMRVKLTDGGNLFRYSTPLENMLLQGFTEEQYNKAKEVASPTQIYNMVGNAIHIGTLQALFKQLYKGDSNESK